MSVETLRDRFAMAALTGVWANRSFNDMSPEATARSCYTMADQMLAARGDAAPQPQPTGDAVKQQMLEALAFARHHVADITQARRLMLPKSATMRLDSVVSKLDAAILAAEKEAAQ